MPKTYNFHHYNPQKRAPGKAMKQEDKQRFIESDLHAAGHGGGGLHYGKKFAETEKLAHEHAEHAKERPMKMSRPQEADEGVVRSHELRGQPIGALPQTDEPFQEPQQALAGAGWGDVVDEAIRGVQRLGGAVRDFGVATARLAKLPFDIAKLLGRRTGEV
jgi:hypothetical protein